MSDPYAALLVPPAPPGPGVCGTCRAFTNRFGSRCGPCARTPVHLDAVVPISYSVGGGPWHRELRAYKDDRSEAVRDLCTHGVAVVLERFLAGHEGCVAAAAGAERFGLVTTVPSHSGRTDDARGRLREIVGERCASTRARYVRALRPGPDSAEAHRWSPGRYRAVTWLAGADVLVIDDTWTTGVSAQGAASALKRAGARRVAVVVLGRHVNPEFADGSARVSGLPAFDWKLCAVHRLGREPAQSRRSSTASSASTMPGSNCVPELAINSARAAAGSMPPR